MQGLLELADEPSLNSVQSHHGSWQLTTKRVVASVGPDPQAGKDLRKPNMALLLGYQLIGCQG